MNALVQSLSYLLSLQYAVIYFNVYKIHGLPNPQHFVIIRYFAPFKTAPLKRFTLPFELTWGIPCFTGELPAASLFLFTADNRRLSALICRQHLFHFPSIPLLMLSAPPSGLSTRWCVVFCIIYGATDVRFRAACIISGRSPHKNGGNPF